MCPKQNKRLTVVRALVVLVATALTAAVAVAQEADAEAFTEIGVQQCALCHFSGGNPILDQFGVTQFVGLNEAQLWFDKDRHFLAFRLIDPRGDGESNRVSRRMCETLDIDVQTFGEPENVKARDCLSCHAGWTDADSPPTHEALQFGVRCESCHGNASEWARPENHQQPTWRAVSPEEKRTTFGMLSLSQPIQRAEVCYSCHIGNVAENKVVTHAMYAAGHPPLPSVELASYSASMGKHWRSLTEKGADFALRDEYLKNHHPYLLNNDGTLRPVENDLPQTRMLLVGGAMAIEYSVRLMHEQSRDPSRSWPDFAAYDCASCHHELRVNSERQPFPVSLDQWLPPGRPMHATWPVVNGRLAAGVSGAVEDVEVQIRALRTVLAEKPFGVTSKLADPQGPAGTLPGAFRQIAEEIATRPLSAADGLEILRTLCNSPDDYRARSDFESARQRAWGIEVVSGELRGKIDFTSDLELFDATVAELKQDLWLRLPNDARSERVAGEPEDRITRQRTIRLEEADRFSPEGFEQKLERLRSLLAP